MLYLRDLNRAALERKRVGREYFKQRLKKKVQRPHSGLNLNKKQKGS